MMIASTARLNTLPTSQTSSSCTPSMKSSRPPRKEFTRRWPKEIVLVSLMVTTCSMVTRKVA